MGCAQKKLPITSRGSKLAASHGYRSPSASRTAFSTSRLTMTDDTAADNLLLCEARLEDRACEALRCEGEAGASKAEAFSLQVPSRADPLPDACEAPVCGLRWSTNPPMPLLAGPLPSPATALSEVSCPGRTPC